MTAAIRPLKSQQVVDAFVASGWSIYKDDAYNWVMVHPSHQRPFVIPKKPGIVSMWIMSKAHQLIGGAPLLAQAALLSQDDP